MKQDFETTDQPPILKLLFRVKSQFADAVVLFRLDDSYLAIEKDATTVANILGTVLAEQDTEGKSQTLTGFPSCRLELNIQKLTKAGHRVAIVDKLN